jgi:hypothetical protein
MKKLAMVALLLVTLLLVLAPPSFAWHGHRHFGGPRVFVGFGVYPYPYYPYYPYYYYPPPYYAYPPPVVVQEPPVYVQQPQVQVTTPPPAPSTSSTPEASWYYCPSGKGYYPSVQTCPEPWVKVPPRQD